MPGKSGDWRRVPAAAVQCADDVKWVDVSNQDGAIQIPVDSQQEMTLFGSYSTHPIAKVLQSSAGAKAVIGS